MIFAIKKELFLRKDELENKTISSLYFGGGTPSLLTVDELNGIIDEVLRYFDFAPNIEITLEANPDDLNKNFVKLLSHSQINRLSIGTQSFFDEDLKLMNRAHNAQEAESSIKRSQDFGFENISIDLIYGSPTSNFEIWKDNLNKTVEFNIPHVSSYALTVEPKTALSSWISKNKIVPPKDSDQNKDFFYMSGFLREQGYDHYEISNFGKPNFHSKHNTSYWRYEPYLGLGPSAHSYNGNNKRSWNVANNIHYIKDIQDRKLPITSELLTEHEQYNELMMIGLRTMWGVNLDLLKIRFSEHILKKSDAAIQKFLTHNLLMIEQNHLKIPEKHWFMADGIASDLFIL